MTITSPRWDNYARDWHLVAAPLRPSAEDLAIYERAIGGWQAGHARPARALLLGVTPEIATMRWPSGTQLLAVDRSGGMIEHVWPAGTAPHGAAVRGDWLKLPLRDASRDVAVGDNPFTRHRYPQGHREMLASLRRVVSPDGLLVLRYFCAPDEPERASQVFADLHAGRIGNFHIFKWRLAMALQPSLDEGVPWGAVWDAWHAEVRDPEGLMRTRGWPIELLRTIEVNRGSADRVTFPTYAEVQAVLGEAFEPVQRIVPRYELGERCPIVIARPR